MRHPVHNCYPQHVPLEHAPIERICFDVAGENTHNDETAGQTFTVWAITGLSTAHTYGMRHLVHDCYPQHVPLEHAPIERICFNIAGQNTHNGETTYEMATLEYLLTLIMPHAVY